MNNLDSFQQHLAEAKHSINQAIEKIDCISFSTEKKFVTKYLNNAISDLEGVELLVNNQIKNDARK